MTIPEGTDSAFDRELARLPVHDARPERVARVRAECLAALGRTRQKAGARRGATALWRARLEAVAATGLAALLLAAVVERAIEVFR